MKVIVCTFCGGSGLINESITWNIMPVPCPVCFGEKVQQVNDDFYPVSNGTYMPTFAKMEEDNDRY